DDDVLVVGGDLPLLTPATLAGLVAHHRATDSACTLLVARDEGGELAERSRVVRGRRGTITELRRPEEAAELDLYRREDGDEAAYGTDDTDDTDEAAVLVCCFRRSTLGPALRRIAPDVLDGEYRLFDVVEVLDRAGYPVGS